MTCIRVPLVLWLPPIITLVNCVYEIGVFVSVLQYIFYVRYLPVFLFSFIQILRYNII